MLSPEAFLENKGRQRQLFASFRLVMARSMPSLAANGFAVQKTYDAQTLFPGFQPSLRALTLYRTTRFLTCHRSVYISISGLTHKFNTMDSSEFYWHNLFIFTRGIEPSIVASFGKETPTLKGTVRCFSCLYRLTRKPLPWREHWGRLATCIVWWWNPYLEGNIEVLWLPVSNDVETPTLKGTLRSFGCLYRMMWKLLPWRKYDLRGWLGVTFV